MSENPTESAITDIKTASSSSEFGQAITLKTTERLLKELREEQQRVIGEWIDDVNNADVALGGKLEPSDSVTSIDAPLVERINLKYTATVKDMLKERKFISAGIIPNTQADRTEGSRRENIRHVFFGVLEDGTKVLELYRITRDLDNQENDRGGFAAQGTMESVTDKNKVEVAEIVANRINKTIKDRQELTKKLEEQKLTDFPKIVIPQA